MGSTQRFYKGSSTFPCGTCTRNTRDTQHTNVRLCAECYEAAGFENEQLDYGDADGKLQRQIDALYNRAVAKGGTIAGYPTTTTPNEETAMNASNAKKTAPAKVAKPKAPAAKPKAPAKPAARKAAPKAPAKPAKPASKRASTPRAGHQQREVKHGMRRPLDGTVGHQLWAQYDKLAAKLPKAADLTVEAARTAGEKLGLNVTSTTIAFYRWRRFQGVRGRGSKQKVD